MRIVKTTGAAVGFEKLGGSGIPPPMDRSSRVRPLVQGALGNAGGTACAGAERETLLATSTTIVAQLTIARVVRRPDRPVVAVRYRLRIFISWLPVSHCFSRRWRSACLGCPANWPGRGNNQPVKSAPF